jgi:hypothetical protein
MLAAAALITLMCSGEANLPPNGKQAFDTPATLDLDNKIITIEKITECSSPEACPLTAVSGTNIKFQVGDSIFGTVDRLSGELIITGTGNGQSVTLYHLTCKPVKPLF